MTEPAGIELWLVDLDTCAAALEQIERDVPRLSADDRERAGAISDAGERARRVAAYTALRVLLERAAGQTVRGQAFTRSPGWKPRLPDGSAEFNLSHAEGMALIGISRSCPLGVDLERARPVRMSPRRIGEIAAVGSGLGDKPLPDLGAERTFLQAWARLEAFTKARGRGLAQTLTDLGLRGKGAPGPPMPLPHVEAAARHLLHEAGLTVGDVTLLPGFHGAVAAARGARVTRVRPFPVQGEQICGLLGQA